LAAVYADQKICFAFAAHNGLNWPRGCSQKRVKVDNFIKIRIALGLCIVLGAGFISLRAADTPAQAAARALLEQKLNQPDAWEPQPLTTATTTPTGAVVEQPGKTATNIAGTTLEKAATPQTVPLATTSAPAPVTVAPAPVAPIAVSPAAVAPVVVTPVAATPVVAVPAAAPALSFPTLSVLLLLLLLISLVIMSFLLMKLRQVKLLLLKHPAVAIRSAAVPSVKARAATVSPVVAPAVVTPVVAAPAVTPAAIVTPTVITQNKIQPPAPPTAPAPTPAPTVVAPVIAPPTVTARAVTTPAAILTVGNPVAVVRAIVAPAAVTPGEAQPATAPATPAPIPAPAAIKSPAQRRKRVPKLNSAENEAALPKIDWAATKVARKRSASAG